MKNILKRDSKKMQHSTLWGHAAHAIKFDLRRSGVFQRIRLERFDANFAGNADCAGAIQAHKAVYAAS